MSTVSKILQSSSVEESFQSKYTAQWGLHTVTPALVNNMKGCNRERKNRRAIRDLLRAGFSRISRHITQDSHKPAFFFFPPHALQYHICFFFPSEPNEGFWEKLALLTRTMGQLHPTLNKNSPTSYQPISIRPLFGEQTFRNQLGLNLGIYGQHR